MTEDTDEIHIAVDESVNVRLVDSNIFNNGDNRFYIYFIYFLVLL